MQEELIQLFRQGNKQAGDDYYNANKNLIYKAAMKFKPKDMEFEETLAIANQAFANVMKKFDPDKAEFSTYFMASARGHILRHYRDYAHMIRVNRKEYQNNRTPIYCDSLEAVVFQSDSKDITKYDSIGADDDYTQILVEEAFNKLNKTDREAFKLQYLKGISQVQIAKILGISQVQVSRHIRRAKATLKVILKDAC